MTLRTVNPYTSYQVLLDLQRTKDQMANLSEQIASGSRLTRLGDDPTASALVLDFQNSIEQNKAYIKQADSATSFLQTTETTLNSVNDAIIRLLELGTQGLGGSTSAAGRAAIAQEVDGIRTNLLALANTQSQGKYIFAGTQTTTQPFTQTAGVIDPYHGNGDSIDLYVGFSTTISTNLTGGAVFFGGGAQGSATDLLQQVTDLRDGLTNNLPGQIQTAYDNLKVILGNISTRITEVGGRQAQLDQLRENVSSYNLSLQTIQSSYQALDYPTAIMDYTNAQTSQEAALSVLGKSNNLNLFNYLV